ncbi:hypothetical protein GCM10027174_24230 [Salinifilum aidingensis]
MSRHRTDRTAELKLVANALAPYYRRATQHIVDVEQWLAANEHRHVDDVLYVVWDRTDAAVLAHVRPDVEVRVAASLVGWARRRADDVADPGDIPGQGTTSTD